MPSRFGDKNKKPGTPDDSGRDSRRRPSVSRGGSQIFHHQERTIPERHTAGDAEHIATISSHIEEHLGAVESVFHELVSDLVHVDVHLVSPTPERPCHTLVTSGMSEVPMHGRGPEGVFKAWAELCLALPPDWPLTQDAFEDEGNYWPLRWLKRLARFPHEYDTWLGWGHTIPNGDPAEPLGPNTDFIGWLLLPPLTTPDGFFSFELGSGREANVFGIYPLYAEEMQLKLEAGTDALIERFEAAGVTEILDLERPNVAL